MNNQVHRKMSTFTSHQVNENSTQNEIILFQFDERGCHRAQYTKAVTNCS